MKELRKIFEKRQKDLKTLLQHYSEDISLEKQHQIYGAINEIEVLLNTLDFANEDIRENKYMN